MLRCSQPRSGMTGKKCPEDEFLIDFIVPQHLRSTHRVIVMDARPLVNAVVNQVMGKGFEKSYENVEVHFYGIENIHVMRESHDKLRKACSKTYLNLYVHSTLSLTRTRNPEKRAARILASGWLKHIQMVLDAAFDVVTEMTLNNSSVVIHCSDGWDRTSQICALAQVIIDPYYRTLVGFEVLIEKEWLSFGHKFDQRVGHTNQNYKDDQRAPIFLQWLDCVWQLLAEFPDAFEFTSHFLHVVFAHVVSLYCSMAHPFSDYRQYFMLFWYFLIQFGNGKRKSGHKIKDDITLEPHQFP